MKVEHLNFFISKKQLKVKKEKLAVHFSGREFFSFLCSGKKLLTFSGNIFLLKITVM